MGLNVPASIKLWGVNIAAKKSYGVGTSYVHAWKELFLEWDWAGWIKPQIDYACGNGVGCNCVRLLGSLEGVFAGTFSQATYSAHWQQLVDYCAGLGVYVYFCGGWFPQVSPASAQYLAGQSTMTDQNIADGINATLADLSSRKNIIGVDAMQEQDGWGVVSGEADPDGRSISIYDKIKAGGTTLPVTFSISGGWTGNTAKNWITSLGTSADYLDFHYYTMTGYDGTNPIAAADFNYYLLGTTRDILCGEFGRQENASYDTIVAFFKSVLTAYSTVGGKQVRGAMMWASTDGNDVTSDEWGMYSTSWVPRTARQSLMRQVTGGSVARAN